MTNADRIRFMSDEELAKWLASLATCPNPYPEWKCRKTCRECWVEWLKLVCNER